MTRIIRDLYPNDEWKCLIKDQRINKAENIFKDQKKKNENISILDCLELLDKYNIIYQSENIPEEILCPKTCLKDILCRSMEFRNSIFHSRYVKSSEIIDLSLEIDLLLKTIADW